MRLRSMLVLTWLLFAGLATAAGFAAVGLVGQGLNVAAAPAAGPTSTQAPSDSTPSPTASTRPPTTPSPRRTTTGPTPRTASRSTKGNFVSATCRGPSVTLSASPAPGWSLDDYRPGPGLEARAKFRSTSDEVEFKVSCSGGRPVFETNDDSGSSGGDG
jgi:hypothetical protein